MILASLPVVACSSTQEFNTALDPSTPGDRPPDAPATEPAPAPATCTVGQCKPTVLAEGQGLDPEHPLSQGPDAIATDDAFVYWMTTWSEIYRIGKEGGKPQKLGDTEGAP